MESAHFVQNSEEMEGLRHESDELKEVLSAVQLDLEDKTEVSHSQQPCPVHACASVCRSC